VCVCGEVGLSVPNYSSENTQSSRISSQMFTVGKHSFFALLPPFFRSYTPITFQTPRWAQTCVAMSCRGTRCLHTCCYGLRTYTQAHLTLTHSGSSDHSSHSSSYELLQVCCTMLNIMSCCYENDLLLHPPVSTLSDLALLHGAVTGAGDHNS